MEAAGYRIHAVGWRAGQASNDWVNPKLSSMSPSWCRKRNCISMVVAVAACIDGAGIDAGLRPVAGRLPPGARFYSGKTSLNASNYTNKNIMAHKKLLSLALLSGLPVAAMPCATAADDTAASSSQSPYVVSLNPEVSFKSMITVGDAVSYKPHLAVPYRLVGIPDGIGAFDNDDDDEFDNNPGRGNAYGSGTFTMIVNHELTSTSGIGRDHGLKGAFISKWIVDKKTLTVVEGEDLIKSAWAWDTGTRSYVPLTAGFTRFCSGDLPALSAFYNKKTGLGYEGRIYMNGEESGTEGRAIAHFLDGNSYELPALGKFAWENSVAHPTTGDKTIVVGTDDGTGGQVYVYAGDKSDSPDDIEAAGLKNGVLYAIKVDGLSAEGDATVFSSGPFVTVNLGDVTTWSGTKLNTESVNAGATSFNRPEDSCWDPSNPKDLYFCTTASFTGKSRLWRLRFTDPAKPELGGTATIILDGTAGPKMMDNLTVSKNGTIIIQEDIGNQAALGKIWRYTISSGALDLIAQHDPQRFDGSLGSPSFLTQDEESSGVIPMDDILGEGWFLFDVQAHYSIPGELVEGGQIVAMRIAKTRGGK